MGNNESAAYCPANDPSSEENNVLKITISTKLKEACVSSPAELNADWFQKNFCSEFPMLGEAIFQHFIQQEANSELTEETFVKQACDFLDQPDKDNLYFILFAKTARQMSKQEVEAFLGLCCACCFKLCEKSLQTQNLGLDHSAVVKCMTEGDAAVVELDSYRRWVQRHCPRLVQGLHVYCAQQLTGAPTQEPHSEMNPGIKDGVYLLTSHTAWLLSCQLPLSYFPPSSHPGNNHPLKCAAFGGWSLLYNSEEQGLSVNRLQHHVFGYEAPTVTLFSFEGHTYCVTCSTPWKESASRWGGSECCVLQLRPEAKIMQSGLDLLLLNLRNRDVPRGLHIGDNARTRFLEIDAEFHKVKHYGLEYPLHRLEVWGCGGEAVLQRHRQQRDWEQREVQKHRDRKLKLDVWEDSADRQLLEMGGVKTRHAEK